MKKTTLIVALAMAAPLAVQAETINIYGWQNHSWEMVDIEDGREFDRIQGNAANIGFAASVDTGMNGIMVNFRCEQFTFVNHFGGFGDWCNRNSKISLSHPAAGEIMFSTWLLPYNEAVAQWVDPFYDAGADSHTSIMGSIGYGTVFYNTGFSFTKEATIGFNRRQENIVQYWSPNWNGFVFRFAWTAGNNDDTKAYDDSKIDPIIRSSSLAYENGPLWLAVTWQDHEDWTALNTSCDHDSNKDTATRPCMTGSDAESYRLAGRYIFDMGGGASFQISAMWEDLEYEFDGIHSLAGASPAGGLPDILDSTATGYAKIEREAWMVSGKVKFGGPLDLRFSYMDADDMKVTARTSDSSRSGDFADSSAEAFNVGLFYTMPAGTELRLTYSEVDNDSNAKYNFGIGAANDVGAGKKVDMIAVGIVHWFD